MLAPSDHKKFIGLVLGVQKGALHDLVDHDMMMMMMMLMMMW